VSDLRVPSTVDALVPTNHLVPPPWADLDPEVVISSYTACTSVSPSSSLTLLCSGDGSDTSEGPGDESSDEGEDIPFFGPFPTFFPSSRFFNLLWIPEISIRAIFF